MDDISPCGNEDIYCIDCIGNGICPFTLEDETVLTDDQKSINDHMIKALKDTLGIDIDAIKALFDREVIYSGYIY